MQAHRPQPHQPQRTARTSGVALSDFTNSLRVSWETIHEVVPRLVHKGVHFSLGSILRFRAAKGGQKGRFDHRAVHFFHPFFGRICEQAPGSGSWLFLKAQSHLKFARRGDVNLGFLNSTSSSRLSNWRRTNSRSIDAWSGCPEVPMVVSSVARQTVPEHHGLSGPHPMCIRVNPVRLLI